MKYRYDPERDCMVDEDGMPMLNQAERSAPVQCPRVFGDIEGYQSPVDGSWVEGRRARRYDLEKNNCIDANELGTKREQRFRNEKFIKKRGLERLADERPR